MEEREMTLVQDLSCLNCIHYVEAAFNGFNLGEPCDSCKFIFTKDGIFPSNFKHPPIPWSELR
jgi:hypothetical protein